VNEINSLTSKLDIVINNAAVNVQDYLPADEGIEMHFGTNHAGLLLFTNMIMAKIRQAAKESSSRGATRIINMTSAGHRLSPIRLVIKIWGIKSKTFLPKKGHRLDHPPPPLLRFLISKRHTRPSLPTNKARRQTFFSLCS
jgi:hypothetical protein